MKSCSFSGTKPYESRSRRQKENGEWNRGERETTLIHYIPVWLWCAEAKVGVAREMAPSAAETLRAWVLSALVVHGAVAGNPDAKRLYDDLLSNYNKLVRPVVNTSDVLRVCIKLKLSQLIDVVRETSSKFSGRLQFIRRSFTEFWTFRIEIQVLDKILFMLGKI